MQTKTTLSIIIISIVVLIFVAFIRGDHTVQNAPAPSATSTISASQDMPLPEPYWHTYTNTVYGYAFAYPQEIQIAQTTLVDSKHVEDAKEIVIYNISPCTMDYCVQIQISPLDNPNNKTLLERAQEFHAMKVQEGVAQSVDPYMQTITNSELIATSTTRTEAYTFTMHSRFLTKGIYMTGGEEYIITEHKGKILLITYDSFNEGTQTILSTFRFVN